MAMRRICATLMTASTMRFSMMFIDDVLQNHAEH